MWLLNQPATYVIVGGLSGYSGVAWVVVVASVPVATVVLPPIGIVIPPDDAAPPTETVPQPTTVMAVPTIQDMTPTPFAQRPSINPPVQLPPVLPPRGRPHPTETA